MIGGGPRWDIRPRNCFTSGKLIRKPGSGYPSQVLSALDVTLPPIAEPSPQTPARPTNLEVKVTASRCRLIGELAGGPPQQRGCALAGLGEQHAPHGSSVHTNRRLCEHVVIKSNRKCCPDAGRMSKQSPRQGGPAILASETKGLSQRQACTIERAAWACAPHRGGARSAHDDGARLVSLLSQLKSRLYDSELSRQRQSESPPREPE
jgi:hypothetical protein